MSTDKDSFYYYCNPWTCDTRVVSKSYLTKLEVCKSDIKRTSCRQHAPGPTADVWQPALSIQSEWDVSKSMIAQDGDKNICTSNPHLLNAFFIHTDLWENLFKDFAQDKGKEADGSHAQSVAHFLQNLPGFLSEGISRCEGLPGKLKGRQSRGEFWKPETRAPFTQTNVINSNPGLWLTQKTVCALD